MAGELIIAGVQVLDQHSLGKAETDELIKLISAALRARGYGLEHYMHYGRHLSALHQWCAQRVARDRVPANAFAQIIENFLDTPEREAAHRMVCSATWDTIEGHMKRHEIEDVAMPVLPLHLELLAQLPLERQGEFWVNFWQGMKAEGAHIRAFGLQRAITDATALPLETDLVELPASSAESDGDSLDIVFGELEVVETPPPPPEPVLQPAPGSGPEFKRTELAETAVLRLVRVLGHGWAETLQNPFRIPDAQVIAWAQQSEEQIEQISRLILGDYTSVAKAIKFVKDDLVDKSKIWDLKRKCMASKGRYVLDSDGFHIVVTQTTKAEPQADIEV